MSSLLGIRELRKGAYAGAGLPASGSPRPKDLQLLRRVACLGDADDVALRVCELGKDHHAGDLRDWHDRLSALRLDLVEVRLRVIDLDVEGDLVAAAVAGA